MTAGCRIAFALALVAAATSGCRTTAQPGNQLVQREFTTAHFVFHYTDIDTPTIVSSAALVEAEFNRIVSDLGVTSMPIVNVTFYRDQPSMQAAVQAAVGTLPANATGLVTGVDQIHLISFSVGGSQRQVELVHEFAHAVSLRANPTFGNRPRWLWETVAVYEARQAVDPRTLPYMTALAPPALAELSSFDNTRVYDVGYTIGEFIVSRGGPAALRALILNNGDTTATLGLPAPDFEREWFAFVRGRYGF